nr:hypothetical protein [Tanacetum cinerariifolium]
VDLTGVEVALDDDFQMRPGAVVGQCLSAFSNVDDQCIHQVAHGRCDQAVLVLKVVTDDAVGDTRQFGDQRDARIAHPDLIDGRK